MAGLLALCVTVATGTARPLASPPTGDAKGLALLARVHRAYVRVPGVALSGRAGTLSFRFTLVLRSGIGVAEQFVGKAASGTTMLVAQRGSPTLAHEPGTHCWRQLAASDPQSFENIGLRFPDQPRMRVKAPQRKPGGWLLPVVDPDGPVTFAIDATSLLIRSVTLATPGQRVVEHVAVLRSAPRLLVPKPRC
jgi:hypothetical protein